MGLEYMEGKASEQDIYCHLVKCNANFVSHLKDKVSIREYSRKLFANAVTFEAWSRDALVGLVAAYFNDRDGQAGYISNVSTIDGYTGKGIASVLIGLSIEYARQHDFKRVSLEVARANDLALRLYKRLQFREAEPGHSEILMILDV